MHLDKTYLTLEATCVLFTNLRVLKLKRCTYLQSRYCKGRSLNIKVDRKEIKTFQGTDMYNEATQKSPFSSNAV